MAFAGTASASTLTSPEGTTYTGNIVATSTNIELDGAFVTIKCNHSESKSTVQQHGAVSAGGSVTSLTFTGCNYGITITKGGFQIIHPNGTITSIGAEIDIHTSVGKCVFTTNNTTIGVLTEGAPAVHDINSAKIPRTGGNFLCGSSGTLTGSYTITTPSSLWVD
jgi:hypothetical protein